ncbi:MAG: UDP-N-acetylmuramate--L-alanine ligase [Desulfarculales bacterium]|jgi:UDP-N-acetylmuramate--alanine ligase|nr:UDP-N-acetylmuramate--L-alanine ligase [Desulfarculales bacterium]
MYQKRQHIHFVGIGGIGMSGIAELLLNLGHQVSGSDLRENENVRRLRMLGACIAVGHDGQNIVGADVVVMSSAVPPDNVEIVAANEMLVPVISRAEMLAELMRLKYGIAVAGAHGKTTTTSILASLMAVGNLDPTVVVGGRLNAFGSNARLGHGDFLVAEADESDGSFNRLSPVVTVVTNIDREHMEHYGSDEALDNAFVEFMNKVPFYGAVVVCLDDPRLAALLPRLRKRTISYGLNAQADFQAREIRPQNGGSSFNLYFKGFPQGKVWMPFPGRHYILNTLGALAAACEIGVDMKIAMAACSEFAGVKRRFEEKGVTSQGALIVDDYAHHPSEIKATLEAARERWPGKRLIVCFQPHRYSRTDDLLDQFAQAFYGADELLLLDIYSAGEKPIPGVDSQLLANMVRKHGHRKVEYIGVHAQALQRLQNIVDDSCVVFTMGAGDVYRISEELLET